MSRWVALGFVLALSGTLPAQDPEFFLPDSADAVVRAGRHMLLAEGRFGYASNALRNEFVDAVRAGGFLSRETRQEALDGLADNNRFGQELGGGLVFLGCDSLFGKPWLQGQVALSHTDIVGGRFTRDLYGLAFFGNAPYEDRTAELAPSALEQQRYQQVGWGVVDHRSWSWARLSFVKGQSFQLVDVREGDLYTAPDGRVLDTRLDGTFSRSDTAQRGWDAFNGLGAALSGRWNHRLDLPWSDGRSDWLSVELRDLGVVYWNDRSLYLDKDTVYAYEGLYVDNIFDVGDLVVDEEYFRDTLALNYATKAQWRMLPSQAMVRLYTRPWQRVGLAVSVRQVVIPGFVPEVGLQAWMHPSNAWRWGLAVRYGGFTTWQAGLQLEGAPGRHLYLRAELPDLVGLASPEGLGRAANAALGWRF